MVRFLLPLLLSASLWAEVTAFYLSWYDDPTTTMTIQWISPHHEPEGELFLEMQDQWESIPNSHHPVHSILVYEAHLKNLKPDTEYRFRIGKEGNVYKFRTAPASLERPLRFVIGGDAYSNKKLFRRMNQTIVKKDPLFTVIGGDIAYALDIRLFRLRSSAFRRWLSFLTEWKEQMVTSDGRVIPFVLVPGNHDIQPNKYELFFNFFAFPKKQLYRALDFNNYLSLILLDTGNFQPIEGRQTLWLKQALSSRTNTPYLFAIYHVAAYPSFYSYEAPSSRKIRQLWCPLFDQYRISAAFENHNHTFKRTYPIKNNKIDYDEGILYLGDGCWGASPRRTNDMWYLEKKARKNNVYLVELTPEKAHIEAIDLLGKPLDEVSLGSK